MSRSALACCLVAAIGLLGTTQVSALTLRVGTGTGCDHATLQAALLAIRNQSGGHTIRINKGNYAVADGMAYAPTVAQSAVFLEGGYDSCTAPTPTGDVTTDVDRAVFNGSGGFPAQVLALQLNGLVGSFQIRRIVLTGGDAINANEFLNAGGGLVVRGAASVLIGLGASIRGNSAGNGGGVALMGAAVNVETATDKVDFYIDEGAEIASNTTAGKGGGIYCGGAVVNGGGDLTRHGSIVFLQGTIAFNQAQNGGGFHCLGSVEGGGGLQPQPRNGQAAWILGNSAGSPGGCGAGQGTLDASVPVGVDGLRRVGAANDQNGLLAVTNNTGFNAGLCLSGSFQIGTSTRPPGQSRFALQNLYLTDQTGTGGLGLSVSNQLALTVRPSGNDVGCSFFAATPCVTLANNSVEQIGGVFQSGDLLRSSSGAELRLIRAAIEDNTTRPNLAIAANASFRLDASVLQRNRVIALSGDTAGSALITSTLAATTAVYHTTVLTQTALDRFFRIDDAGTIASARASIFASTAIPAPANAGGTAATTAFRRQYCGYFQSTADFAGHTVVNDPGLGTFVVLPPTALQLNPTTLEPMHTDLIDACSTTSDVNRDHYGRIIGTAIEPGATVAADIGAVEAQRPDPLFSNGFE
jgi:hypothetical protein